MAISSIKNDGFRSGYRWALSLSHGSAMGASEAKQDNLREVESQVAALQKLLGGSAFDDVSTMSNPGLINLGLKSGVKRTPVISCPNGTALNDQLRRVIDIYQSGVEELRILFTSNKFPR